MNAIARLMTIGEAKRRAADKARSEFLGAMPEGYATAKEIGEKVGLDGYQVSGLIRSCTCNNWGSIRRGPKKYTKTSYAKINEDGSVNMNEVITIRRAINTYKRG